MKKLIVFLFTIVLLLPNCAFARKQNYNSLCSTLPASAPVQITLSEIGYSQGHTFIVQEGYNKGEIITNQPKVYSRHALKNNTRKTITSYTFKVKIYRDTKYFDDEIIYQGNIDEKKCKIKSGRSSAQTWYQVYNDSKEYHRNIRNHLTDHISKIVYELYFIGYSDGTYENFNP